MPGAQLRRDLSFLLLALCYLGLAACGRVVHGHQPLGAAPGELVHIVSNGWHTGVVVPGDVRLPGRGPLRFAPAGHRHLEVGWGDRDAYVAERITVRLALRAAFASRGSVLMVTGFDEAISERYRGVDVVELRVSPEALGALLEFVEASLAVDSEGRPIRLEGGWTPWSAFYVARGHFHLLNTCNAWTARALQAAGLPLAPALTLTAYHLVEQVVPFGRRVVARPA